jgi:hypothetical protein
MKEPQRTARPQQRSKGLKRTLPHHERRKETSTFPS